MFFDQRIDLSSTGPPPARRTSPAAVMENLVNGDKADMVNGTLPGSIAGRPIPCYRNRLGTADDSGAGIARSPLRSPFKSKWPRSEC
jgi:hypothetical protein